MKFLNRNRPINEQIDRAKGGDREAFSQLYETLSGRLLSIMRDHPATNGLSDAIVEEICHDAWIVAYQRLGTFNERQTELLTWLRGIAVNLARNAGRLQANQYQPLTDETLETVEIETAGKVDADALDALLSAEAMTQPRQHILRKVINELSDRYSTVLNDELDGLTPKEIAEKRNLNPSTVYKRLTTGYEQVNTLLQQRPKLLEELRDTL